MTPAKPQTDSKALPQAEQLASAIQLFHEIVRASGQPIRIDPDARPATKMVYTHGVTLYYLGEISEPILGSQRIFILDGTTITLPPTPALRAAYPAAPNQYGESVWPVAMLMVAHEMQSGCALLPQVDPMYGAHNASEAEQARRIVQQLPARSIVIADSDFGIFSVAYQSTQSRHDFLSRLTKSRFQPLRRRAELIDQGPTHRTYRLVWKPSSKDRQTNPDLPAEASLEVLLHEVESNG